ncbi:MAG: hypothetical protein K2K28_00410 [Clostridia bacterium]|nr:hypothetical protein [Clostridia bacterium]
MLDYYNDDSTYEIDCGTIEITCYNNGGKHITVYENNEVGLSFMLLDSNYKILEDNGFISLCNVKKQNENVTVYESTEAVTMITNHRSAIHGYYRAVVVELSVGDITYLDYQSGKMNMIEYINSIR